jgi:predicted nucleotidyltransferase
MAVSISDLTLKERILKTIEIVDRRDYDLSLDKLSEDLVGGNIDKSELAEILREIPEVATDSGFVGHRRKLRTEKCMKRVQSHSRYQDAVMNIANEYTESYARLNPHVKCIMVTGSAATGGFCEEDDIDLNFIVEDGTKYSSYLLAVLLSSKYSMRYGRRFKSRFIAGVPKVICVNVVWEASQVKPFVRQDGQVAYELLNSKVLYNPEFFESTVRQNKWLAEWFPQIYSRDYRNGGNGNGVNGNGGGNGNGRRGSPKLVEGFSRGMLFSFYHLVRMLRANGSSDKARMEYVERAKYPYGIFHRPESKFKGEILNETRAGMETE